MKLSSITILLMCGALTLLRCKPAPEAADTEANLESVIVYCQDTLHPPSIADSIHLWIVPNHMLWIPLEFEDPYAQDVRIEKNH